MKVSKKEIAKFQKKEQARSAGRVAYYKEQEEAWDRLTLKLQDPKVMAVFKRMKDR
jgi:hypothetical protein